MNMIFNRWALLVLLALASIFAWIFWHEAVELGADTFVSATGIGAGAAASAPSDAELEGAKGYYFKPDAPSTTPVQDFKLESRTADHISASFRVPANQTRAGVKAYPSLAVNLSTGEGQPIRSFVYSPKSYLSHMDAGGTLRLSLPTVVGVERMQVTQVSVDLSPVP